MYSCIPAQYISILYVPHTRSAHDEIRCAVLAITHNVEDQVLLSGETIRGKVAGDASSLHTVQYGIHLHTCDLEQTFRPKFAYPSLQKHEDRGSKTDVLNHLIMA